MIMAIKLRDWLQCANVEVPDIVRRAVGNGYFKSFTSCELVLVSCTVFRPC